MKVLLPTPGTPLMPRRSAWPLAGSSALSSASARSRWSARVDSSSVMILASARRCAAPAPASRAWHRGGGRVGQAATRGRVHGWTGTRVQQRILALPARLACCAAPGRRGLQRGPVLVDGGDQAVVGAEEGSREEAGAARWSTRTTETCGRPAAARPPAAGWSSPRGNAPAPRRRHRHPRSVRRWSTSGPAGRHAGRARAATQSRACTAAHRARTARRRGQRGAVVVVVPFALHRSAQSRGCRYSGWRAALEGTQFHGQQLAHRPRRRWRSTAPPMPAALCGRVDVQMVQPHRVRQALEHQEADALARHHDVPGVAPGRSPRPGVRARAVRRSGPAVPGFRAWRAGAAPAATRSPRHARLQREHAGRASGFSPGPGGCVPARPWRWPGWACPGRRCPSRPRRRGSRSPAPESHRPRRR
jgi:hypothetical protein